MKTVNQANEENKMSEGPKMSISVKLANFITFDDNSMADTPAIHCVGHMPFYCLSSHM